MRILQSKAIRFTVSAVLGFGLTLGSDVVLSEDGDPSAPAGSGPSLADQATNPTSPLMQLRLQNQYQPSWRDAGSYGNAALFQGVFPTALGWGSGAQAVINRITVPYVTTPKLGGGSHAAGLGDTAINTFFITSWLPKGEVFAWGPSMTIPTAGDNASTGGGSWQAGPTAVYLNTKTKNLQWGLMMYQQWSFSKVRSSAQDTSVLSIQPIVTKHFSKGWYIATPDSPNTYDFKNDRWTLNLGAVLGRVTTWGTRPVQIFGGIYFNPVSYNNVPSSRMTIKLNISFLYPQ